MKNKPYFLALNKIPSIGPQTVISLWSRWPALKEMFSLSSQQLQKAGLSERLARLIKKFNFSDIEEDLSWEESGYNHILSLEDPDYPSLLKEIPDPPIVLYAKGNLSCLKQVTISIVGTRKPSISGYETAFQFASALASQGLTVVSGLALGIDAQAHRGCLALGGKTIAVMGTGIQDIYPRQHQKLAEEISANGLLLTEFPLKTPPASRHFPRRNRIISGLSLATLVVEAAIKSGSLITARLALEQNRDVLAIPGSILNPQARGCHYLLQQGARLVTSIQDVMEELGLECKHIRETTKTLSLVTNDKSLIKLMGFEITSMDDLISRSGWRIEDVASSLATLEIKGIIKAVPGGYMRCV